MVRPLENDMPIDLTEFEDIADFQASVAGLSEGLADLEAGRTLSFEEVVMRGRTERQERRRRREGPPTIKAWN